MDLIPVLVNVFASVILALITYLARFIARTVFGKDIFVANKESVETYSAKLARLTQNLNQASSEVDSILRELAQVSIDRATSVQKLEEEMKRLAEREQETKKRIQDLENVPLAVAEHFAKLTEPGEKRGARRDYMLFIAGLAAGQLLQIVLKYFGY